MFVNVVFVIILLFLFFQFSWTDIQDTLVSVPAEQSKINPFHTSEVENFNFWYFCIGVLGVLYGAMSWQGTQGYNASAKSAHEAKMGGVLTQAEVARGWKPAIGSEPGRRRLGCVR